MAEIDLSFVWKIELEILDEIHRICSENNLKYSLAYGTLLGAVRHQGFIPWDDDIDIMMPRKDYNQLLAIWDSVAKKEFILQNKLREPNFTQNFTKIRKDNTAYVQDEYELQAPYHTGVFVDIFPADRLAPEGFQRKNQRAACMLNLLYSRGHSSKEKSARIEKILLAIPKTLQLAIFKKTEKIMQKWDNNGYLWFMPSTKDTVYWYYPADMFDDLKLIPFCDREYMCINDPDAALRVAYGDYLKLPPEEERVLKHHPLVFYENKEWKGMK